MYVRTKLSGETNRRLQKVQVTSSFRFVENFLSWRCTECQRSPTRCGNTPSVTSPYLPTLTQTERTGCWVTVLTKNDRDYLHVTCYMLQKKNGFLHLRGFVFFLLSEGKVLSRSFSWSKRLFSKIYFEDQNCKILSSIP